MPFFFGPRQNVSTVTQACRVQDSATQTCIVTDETVQDLEAVESSCVVDGRKAVTVFGIDKLLLAVLWHVQEVDLYDLFTTISSSLSMTEGGRGGEEGGREIEEREFKGCLLGRCDNIIIMQLW